MDPPLPQSTVVSQDVKKTPGTSGAKKIILIIGMILVFAVLLAAAYYFLLPRLKTEKQTEISPPPAVKQGASFLMVAEPSEVALGGQIKVSVLVKSDLDQANLFVAKLKFPSDLLQAENINLRSESTSSGFIKNWFISNWVENTIDNNTGSVSLVGGVPNPGFQTQTESTGSAMADVIFKTIASGEAKITFDDTSAIYRNSDNINILVSKQGIIVKILGEKAVSSAPSSTPTATPAELLEGDINKDNRVDLVDLSFFLSVWGKSGFEVPEADLNKDEIINAFDYSRLMKILKEANQIQ